MSDIVKSKGGAKKASKRNSSKKSAPEKKKLKTPPGRLIEMAHTMAHFTGKLVNPKITPNPGIRLGSESRLALPYVSVTTLGAENVPMELLTGNIVTLIAPAKEMLRAVEAGKRGQGVDEDGRSPAEAKEIASEYSAVFASGRQEFNVDHVSRYLRQIFLPHPGMDEGYLSVTPLSSSGVSYLINQALEEQARGSEENSTRWVKKMDFPIGGANSQNVGHLVRESAQPLFFEGPRVDRSVQRTLSQYYRGVSVPVDRAALAKFVLFWVHVFNPAGATHNARIRRHFASYWESVARSYLESLLAVREELIELSRKSGLELDGELTLRGGRSGSLPLVAVDAEDSPDRRQAHRLVATVARTKVRVEGEWVSLSSLGFTESHKDFQRAVTVVRRILRSI